MLVLRKSDVNRFIAASFMTFSGESDHVTEALTIIPSPTRVNRGNGGGTRMLGNSLGHYRFTRYGTVATATNWYGLKMGVWITKGVCYV